MAQRRDIDALISAMTLQEKASLCSGRDFWTTQNVDAHGIPAVMLTDGPHGLRKQQGASDHIGLNESVPATCFPPAAALASTWDPVLLNRIGVALGEECRQENVAVLLGPGINMKRSPLCGRNFEYFSEDPVQAGELGAALIAGIQSQGVGTSVKHFAANNQETDRLRVSAEVDERTLREIYLAAFERVVTGSAPWTVMCSYNRINGTYASEDPWLLTSILREEWGFAGVVVSDWGAVNERVPGLLAGLDLEMPGSGGATDAEIVAAVRAGTLDESVLDTAVARILQLLERVRPGIEAGGRYDSAGHHELAREAAGQSVVLLKNDRSALPLDPSTVGSLAVIGAFAKAPRYQGAGSSQVTPTRLEHALAGLRRLAAGVEVSYAAGFSIDDEADDPALVAEAVAAATAAERVVLFLGLPARYESEGFDRTDLDLPANQLNLLRAIVDTGRDVVVVLANGGVVSLEPWHDSVAAIVEGWLGGQAGGGAIADVLFGVVNPSGKLAETIPFALADTPSHVNFPGERGKVRYGEGVFIGYRWYDMLGRDVRYPFGHGLSYTTFSYRDLVVRAVNADAGQVEVRCTVTNTGAVAGSEVVQLYVGDPESTVRRPVRELKAFAKVSLDPGASETVVLTLAGRDFSFYDVRLGGWKREGGVFILEVGASSRDIRLSGAIELPDDGATVPLDHGSTLGEWLAHPVGGDLLRSRVFASLNGDAESLSAEIMQMLASMPLTRFSRFPGVDLTAAALTALLAEANA